MHKIWKSRKAASGRALFILSCLVSAFLLTACQAREGSLTGETASPGATLVAPSAGSNTVTTGSATPAGRPVSSGAIRPPAQPADGPGGKNYPYGAVHSTVTGQDASAVHIFEPQQPTPADAIPVVLFLHGYDALDPRAYIDWIDHIVRRGSIVIYPQYQVQTTKGLDFLPNILQNTQAALAELARPGHVRPDLAKFFIVGHSLGGLETANVAAVAAQTGLPVPLAIMPVEPAHFPSTENQGCPANMPNSSRQVTGSRSEFGKIPASTLLIVVTGQDDQIVGIMGACQIWLGTAQIPAPNKVFVTLQSDDHGTPDLAATHFAPVASPTMDDALDYYGTWKLFDALQSCAISKSACDIALGGSPAHTSMGNWSDGTPVKPLLSTKTPF